MKPPTSSGMAYYRAMMRLLMLIEDSGQLCPWCGVFLSSVNHRKDCPVTEARKLGVEFDQESTRQTLRAGYPALW